MSLAVAVFVTLLFIVSCSRQTAIVQRTTSMLPTIQDGEEVLVNYTAYKKAAPERWDVVVFRLPLPAKGLWIFRVVGLPNDLIAFDSRGLLINGKIAKLPRELFNVNFVAPQKNRVQNVEFPFTVPEGTYFVLGDNPDVANDSRMWGAVRREEILGRVE
jgi:signal peptidase I